MSDEIKPLSAYERAEIEKRLFEISARMAEVLAIDAANRESGELIKLLDERLELQKRIPKPVRRWPR